MQTVTDLPMESLAQLKRTIKTGVKIKLIDTNVKTLDKNKGFTTHKGLDVLRLLQKHKATALQWRQTNSLPKVKMALGLIIQKRQWSNFNVMAFLHFYLSIIMVGIFSLIK